MGRIPDIKRIQKSDFESDQQELVDKLAFPINSFMEQTRSALDHNIDFTNLNQEIITLETMTDALGRPILETKYKSVLKTKVIGHSCINAFNLTDNTIYPISTPFLSFEQNANIVTILHVSGLQAGNKYRLVVLSIGQ